MAIINPHARTPEFRSLLKAASKYFESKASNQTAKQNEASAELKRRLRRLENDCNRLIKINNLLLDSQAAELSFDESSDSLVFTHRGESVSIKLNRADPSVPISIPGVAATSGYVAGAAKNEKDESDTEELKMVMEQLLEHYYSNAFRITKLVQQTTNQKKYHCMPITMVRNKLVEHPDSGSLYSFGYGSNGPLVKPMHQGTNEWTDAGLVANTTELVTSLKGVLKDDT
jgi:hypothetical protein